MQQAMPDWWITSSGVFFVLGTAVLILMAVATCVLIYLLLDLRKQIQGLVGKVNEVADKADAIATNLKDVSQEVGTRARGIVRVVDDHANTAFGIIEKFAPLFLGIGLISKILKLVRPGRRRR